MRLLLVLLSVLFVATGARADEITMIGGDVLHGRIVEETDDLIVLMHDVVGRVAIPRTGVAALRRDNAQGSTQDPSAPADAPGPAPAPNETAAPLAVEPDAGEWKTHIDVGVDFSDGNTDETKLSVGFESRYTSPIARSLLDGRYYYKISDGDTTDNTFHLTATRDWLLPDSKWFYFVQGTYDFDQFESWRHRASGHGGPGYRLVEADDHYLDIRGGLGPKKEWGSDNDSVKFEGLAGLEFGWEITERQSLRINTTIFPVVDDTDDYRTREVVSWRYRLDNDTPLSLTLRLTHEHQAQVDPGKDRKDIRLLVGVSLDF